MSRPPRICVSIPVHERPEVVLDQVANLRSFLPADTVVVLHAARGFSPLPGGRELEPGVYVNPVSLRTAWGDTLPAHDANFRFATQVEDFDVFLMHASNDMYVRGGAERRIAQGVAACQLLPTHPSFGWPQGRVAHEDPALAKILRDLGTRLIFGTQPEGNFFARELFAEVLERIARHWRPGEGGHYPREEVYVPTIVAALLDETPLPPLLYSELMGRPMSEETVHAVRTGTLRATQRLTLPPEDLALYGPDAERMARPVLLHDVAHLYAVKRVPRVLDAPLRTFIRGLAAVERARGVVEADARGTRLVARASELLGDPELLRAFRDAYSDAAQVTLVVAYDGERQLEALADATAAAGLDEPGAPDVLAVELPETAVEELACSAGLRYGRAPATGAAPLVGPAELPLAA